MDKELTYYLAGRMSGIPQLNFPRFMQVAHDLRESGWKLISPVELDSPEEKDYALQSDGQDYGLRSWGHYLSRDIEIVADQVDGVIVIDDWWKSKGARLEVFTALQLKKPLVRYKSPIQIFDLSEPEALDMILMGMGDYLLDAA